MLIAQEKQRKNIAEYILYMWQIEDILRGFHFDMKEIESNIIAHFPLPEGKKAEVREWYAFHAKCMLEEGIAHHGHLKMLQEILNELVEIHTRLVKEEKDEPYLDAFRKALPHIVRIRASAGEHAKGEIETCFEALYGVMLLRLKHTPISQNTQEALKDISRLLSLLAYRYHHR